MPLTYLKPIKLGSGRRRGRVSGSSDKRHPSASPCYLPLSGQQSHGSILISTAADRPPLLPESDGGRLVWLPDSFLLPPQASGDLLVRGAQTWAAGPAGSPRAGVLTVLSSGPLPRRARMVPCHPWGLSLSPRPPARFPRVSRETLRGGRKRVSLGRAWTCL